MSADAGRIAAAVFHQAATLSEAQTPCRRMQGELRQAYFLKPQRFLKVVFLRFADSGARRTGPFVRDAMGHHTDHPAPCGHCRWYRAPGAAGPKLSRRKRNNGMSPRAVSDRIELVSRALPAIDLGHH